MSPHLLSHGSHCFCCHRPAASSGRLAVRLVGDSPGARVGLPECTSGHPPGARLTIPSSGEGPGTPSIYLARARAIAWPASERDSNDAETPEAAIVIDVLGSHSRRWLVHRTRRSPRLQIDLRLICRQRLPGFANVCFTISQSDKRNLSGHEVVYNVLYQR